MPNLQMRSQEIRSNAASETKKVLSHLTYEALSLLCKGLQKVYENYTQFR